jgi:hypothetical protein
MLKESNIWDQFTIKRASSVFQIPFGTHVLMICPKYLYGEELIKHEQFQVFELDEKETKTSVAGGTTVLPMAHGSVRVTNLCDSNAFECQNALAIPSGIHTGTSLLPFFWCTIFL